jgi:acetylornithine deacetylase
LMKSFFCVIFVAATVITYCAAGSYDDFRAKIRDYIHKVHRNEPKNKKMLQDWIQQASFQGNETGIQDMVAKTLKEDLHFDVVDVWDMSQQSSELHNHELFKSPRDIESLKQSPIVVGVLHPASRNINIDLTGAQQPVTGTKHRSIILNGHVDVVPIGIPDQWKYNDPFSGKYYLDESTGEERIHGRGTTDMKGGIFSSLIAVQALQYVLNTTRLNAELIFQSVVEEESGGSGTLATVLRGYGKADAAIVPEPTQMKLFPQQQGSMWFKVHVYGKQAHGGTRYNGISAIEKSIKVVESILDLEEKRNQPLRSRKLFSQLPIPVPINIGKINGGQWPSSVCDHVVLEGRFGVIPDGKETTKSAQVELEEWLKTDLIKRDKHFEQYPVKVEWYGAAWVPGFVDENHDIVKVISRAYKNVVGSDIVIESSPWGTDAGYLNVVGGTPAVVVGPGDTALAHQLDESISVDKIYQCAEVIAVTLLEWVQGIEV